MGLQVGIKYSVISRAMANWGCMMVVAVVVLVVVARPAGAAALLLDLNCSESMTKLAVPAQDPCSNTTAYSELGACANFMAGNSSTPSSECCASAQSVWAAFPACFCKVTFFSKFPGEGPARARARAPLCNITDDLCASCPHFITLHQSESGSEHSKKINTASVVTISVIVTLAIVGIGALGCCCCKKKALWKQKPGPSKTYVPQFNNV